MDRFLSILLAERRTLTEDESRGLFGAMLRGESSPEQSAAALAAMQVRGPTVDELTGAARVMREHAEPVPVAPELIDSIIDTCGTGGAPKTFNVSTAAALIAASADTPAPVRVAKHGNRSRTGRGSAEVLAQLGVHIDASPAQQARCLEEAGVCFCFAIHHHPAMRHVGPVRRQIASPTPFNLLGPLTNPVGATRQLLGVYDPAAVETVARTLQRLGSVRAMVVRGDDGLDELTTTNTSTAWSVTRSDARKFTIAPEDAGLARSSMAKLVAGSLVDAGDVIRRLLSGEAGPKRDIAVLNAAAALLVAGATDDLRTAAEMAADAIDSGRAAHTLDALARVSHLS